MINITKYYGYRFEYDAEKRTLYIYKNVRENDYEFVEKIKKVSEDEVDKIAKKRGFRKVRFDEWE